MGSRFIQWFVRLILSIKYNFKLEEVVLPESFDDSDDDSIFQQSPATVSRNVANGVTNAAYGNRFVIIPFEYFAAIVLEKRLKDVTNEDLDSLSQENKLLNNELDTKAFAQEFENWRERFFSNYSKHAEKDIPPYSIINEEIFHNTHLGYTSTWTTSQALTVGYRLSSSYLTSYRDKLGIEIVEMPKHLEITSTLLNIYFIRQLIARNSTPFVEAYFHFRDENVDEIKTIYDPFTWARCRDYIWLEKYLTEAFPTEALDLLSFISKSILNYPYAFQLARLSGFDYVKFESYFDGIPLKRILAIRSLLESNKFVSAETLKASINSLFNAPSNFETNFAPVIMHYATNGMVPQQLVSFVLRGAFLSKYRLVMFHYFLELFRGGKKFDNSYSDMPAIRCYGMSDQVFNLDPAMKLFRGKAFLVARSSFEPTLAGENGFKNILQSDKCFSLLIQTVFLKAIYFVCEVGQPFHVFREDFSICYRARPWIVSHKAGIEALLEDFFTEAKRFEILYKIKKRETDLPFDIEFSREFEKGILNLASLIEKQDTLLRQKFLAFCEINYAHGF